MRCPICQTEFAPTASAARPFCGERCRTIDLGRWLGECYAVPLPPDPEAEEYPLGEVGESEEPEL
ncbi:MAG: DNA gyrase inhibitor YacG [Pirellulales bacterium]|nr:DNA gyrase inhibitor YacG [Pirellulales bacterium]